MASDTCPTCDSSDRFIVKGQCASDQYDPDPWHRNRHDPMSDLSQPANDRAHAFDPSCNCGPCLHQRGICHGPPACPYCPQPEPEPRCGRLLGYVGTNRPESSQPVVCGLKRNHPGLCVPRSETTTIGPPSPDSDAEHSSRDPHGMRIGG